MADQSCTWGMIHTEIHHSRPGCLLPSLGLQWRISASNTIHSSIHLFITGQFARKEALIRLELEEKLRGEIPTKDTDMEEEERCVFLPDALDYFINSF